MTFLLLLPAILCLLVLAAHFLRAGDLLAVIALLALLPLLALRRTWVAIIARWTLWLGSGIWIYSIVRIADLRIRFGQPWARMAIILGGVALFTLLASLPFGSRRLRGWYRPGPDAGAQPPQAD